jgi:hypothetical protein
MNGGDRGLNMFKRKEDQSKIEFIEDDTIGVCGKTIAEDGSLQPPTNAVKVPYWQMHVIRKTIMEGAFITPSVYVPTAVWNQVAVRFSGMAAKTSAYEALVNIIQTQIFPLRMQLTEQSLLETYTVLRAINETLIMLQNQLSKSFPFIHETSPSQTESPVSQSKNQMSWLTSRVATLGKNVRKYAEVGLSRINAMSTIVSEEDFAAYVDLTCNLCEYSQKFDEIHDASRKLRRRADTLANGAGGAGEDVDYEVNIGSAAGERSENSSERHTGENKAVLGDDDDDDDDKAYVLGSATRTGTIYSDRSSEASLSTFTENSAAELLEVRGNTLECIIHPHVPLHEMANTYIETYLMQIMSMQYLVMMYPYEHGALADELSILFDVFFIVYRYRVREHIEFHEVGSVRDNAS